MKRASDADRERALRELRLHYAAGRLEDEELEERAAQAARAKTQLELKLLLIDLPKDYRGRASRAAARADRAALRAHVATYGTVNGSLLTIWALAGAGAFWPVWAIAPWGIFLGAHAMGSRAVRRRLDAPPARRGLAR